MNEQKKREIEEVTQNILRATRTACPHSVYGCDGCQSQAIRGQLIALITEPPKGDKDPEATEQAKEILNYLNEKADRKFSTVAVNIALIKARLKEVGADVSGIKAMIDSKVDEWKSDPMMSKFLRPATLFGKQKFQGYYDDRDVGHTPPPVRFVPLHIIGRLKDRIIKARDEVRFMDDGPKREIAVAALKKDIAKLAELEGDAR